MQLTPTIPTLADLFALLEVIAYSVKKKRREPNNHLNSLHQRSSELRIKLRELNEMATHWATVTFNNEFNMEEGVMLGAHLMNTLQKFPTNNRFFLLLLLLPGFFHFFFNRHHIIRIIIIKFMAITLGIMRTLGYPTPTQPLYLILANCDHDHLHSFENSLPSCSTSISQVIPIQVSRSLFFKFAC